MRKKKEVKTKEENIRAIERAILNQKIMEYFNRQQPEAKEREGESAYNLPLQPTMAEPYRPRYEDILAFPEGQITPLPISYGTPLSPMRFMQQQRVGTPIAPSFPSGSSFTPSSTIQSPIPTPTPSTARINLPMPSTRATGGRLNPNLFLRGNENEQYFANLNRIAGQYGGVVPPGANVSNQLMAGIQRFSPGTQGASIPPPQPVRQTGKIGGPAVSTQRVIPQVAAKTATKAIPKQSVAKQAQQIAQSIQRAISSLFKKK